MTTPLPPETSGDELQLLMQTIVARRDQPSARSYTQVLFAGGDELIGQKILEEAAEVVDAAHRLTVRQNSAPISNPSDTDAESDRKLGTTQHLVHEAADLIYHLWVMLAAHRIPLDDLRAELGRRAGVSGLDEKASRKP